MILVNAGGRVVEVDDVELIARCLAMPGFREASDEEQAEFYRIRKARHEKKPVKTTLDLYYKTVRQTPDGYGMSRDHLARELMNVGINVQENSAGQKIGLLYNYPYSINGMENDVRLIYTMFESDKIPADWPDYLKQADEVLVPSNFVAQTFAKSGIKATVVPLGYNDKVFKQVNRDTALEQNRDFVFVHYNAFNLRKGFSEVLKAFTQEFRNDEPVKLILKTTHDTPPIPLHRSVYPNIEVITGSVPEKDLFDILARSDCMVYPSRGEGFGLTPLEAMATGLPTIVPNAHGISEYFNNNYMLEVKVAEKCPGLYHRFKGQDVGEMVICDVDDLRRQMRWVYNHQEQARKLGIRSSAYVQKFTYHKTAEALKTILDKWQATNIVKRRDSPTLQTEEI